MYMCIKQALKNVIKNNAIIYNDSSKFEDPKDFLIRKRILYKKILYIYIHIYIYIIKI